jgi:hypothetical protein
MEAMKSLLFRTQIDPESVGALLAAVRCLAKLTGDTEISLRIALSGEKCERCECLCETFIEPAGVCTICWSILILSNAVEQLTKPFERVSSRHASDAPLSHFESHNSFDQRQ